jgi:methyl-accepting chemotaxis protein
VEEAFRQLGKMDAISRSFDCGACGSDTCREMAVKIAKKINFPENCIQKAHAEMKEEHAHVLDWQARNAGDLQSIRNDVANIKELADKIMGNLSNVTEVIGTYDAMSKDINKIASNIHMISLNASIEAARAGEHGKSFAVVAESIRDLAGATQKATAQMGKASLDAKNAMQDISGMVVTIGGDIAESLAYISKIASSTQEVLKT